MIWGGGRAFGLILVKLLTKVQGILKDKAYHGILCSLPYAPHTTNSPPTHVTTNAKETILFSRVLSQGISIWGMLHHWFLFYIRWVSLQYYYQNSFLALLAIHLSKSTCISWWHMWSLFFFFYYYINTLYRHIFKSADFCSSTGWIEESGFSSDAGSPYNVVKKSVSIKSGVARWRSINVMTLFLGLLCVVNEIG